MVRSFMRYCRASSGERMSGSLTISISGTPERLTSTRLYDSPGGAGPVQQLGDVLFQVDAGDADRVVLAPSTSML